RQPRDVWSIRTFLTTPSSLISGSGRHFRSVEWFDRFAPDQLLPSADSATKMERNSKTSEHRSATSALSAEGLHSHPLSGKIVLQIVVFVSGAVLMALEIGGSRVLAPHFGNSVFVWGSLISIVLIALSLG